MTIRKRDFESLIMLMLTAGIGLLLWTAVQNHEGPSKRVTIYKAWTNATSSRITFDEWELLRAKELLPGQERKREAQTIFIPINQ